MSRTRDHRIPRRTQSCTRGSASGLVCDRACDRITTQTSDRISGSSGSSAEAKVRYRITQSGDGFCAATQLRRIGEEMPAEPVEKHQFFRPARPASSGILLTHCIFCVIEPVLPMKYTEPLYVALIGSAPFGNVEVVYDATPPLNVTVPRAVVPRLNVTPPVAIPEY